MNFLLSQGTEICALIFRLLKFVGIKFKGLLVLNAEMKTLKISLRLNRRTKEAKKDLKRVPSKWTAIYKFLSGTRDHLTLSMNVVVSLPTFTVISDVAHSINVFQ